MSFNLQSWGRISGAANNVVVTLQNGTFVGAPNVFTYVSATDLIATIEAANYFNAVVSELNIGDLIYAVGTDATAFLTVATLVVSPPAVTVSTGFVSGDVQGPGSSTNNDIVVFNGVTGKIIKDSGVTIGNIQAGAIIYAADAGVTDAYAITLAPVPAAYVAGMVVNFKANTANTTGATLNVNGLGAKAILKEHDQVLATGDIEAGQFVTVIYDGTQFQMQSQLAQSPVNPYAVLQDGSPIYGASATGNDTYVVTLSPVPAAYTDGMTIRFKPDTANTAAATLNVNGLGAVNIVKFSNESLETGDIIVNEVVSVVYNSTGPVFQLVNPQVATTGTTSLVRATSPTLVTPILGTPTSGNLVNTTGYGALRSFQVFTSGTAATYTTPAGIKNILVEAVGGGGGGGGCAISTGGGAAGGGGGGGGYGRLLITSAAATYTYTVGPGGAGGTAGNNNGAAGTASTFSTLSAGGGVPGNGSAISTTAAIQGAQGAGGSSSGGNVNVVGGNGTTGMYVNAAGATGALGGNGGGTFFAPGITASPAAATGPSGIANTGSGGAGACASNNGTAFAGGAGGSGLIIVWEFA